jgi:hypothetical protein
MKRAYEVKVERGPNWQADTYVVIAGSDEEAVRSHHNICICVNCETTREDAARYRWLRDKAGNKVMKSLVGEARPPQWDVIVDKDRGMVSATGDGEANE